MSQLGIGALLHLMGGGSQQSSDKYIGRVISSAEVRDDALFVDFTDGTKIKIFDDGQSCCERRYMSTDDDPSSLVGASWLIAEVSPGPDGEADYDAHEQAFLTVKTDGGLITIVNHNEHNGYYGGFGMTIHEIEPPRSAQSKEGADQ